MKFTALALTALALVAPMVDAFSPQPTSFVGARATPGARAELRKQLASSRRIGPLSATVGVVGATGAVGKEILGCLDKREFPVDKLRIFGSARCEIARSKDDELRRVDLHISSFVARFARRTAN